MPCRPVWNVVTNDMDLALRPSSLTTFGKIRGRITSMLLSRLAETRIALTATRSRNAKRI